VEQNEAGAKALNALSTAAFNAATSTSLMTASQLALANALGASLGARLGTGRSEYDLGSTNNNFTVNVSAGTITNEQGVVDVVQQALQEINARGWSQFKTGGLVAL
jgi:hypothetical protein